MTSRRLVISGRVQGVGYRYWLRDLARLRDVSGWVRNRADGTVEAVFAGEEAAIDALIARCRVGPPGAEIVEISVTPGAEEARGPFTIRPTS